jgi:hypothetical protein
MPETPVSSDGYTVRGMDRRIAVTEFVRDFIRRKVEVSETYKSLGDLVGMTGQGVSMIANGQRNVGSDSEDRWAEAMGHRSIDDFRRAAVEWAKKHRPELESVVRRIEPSARAATQWGDLPGWLAAETEARRRWPHVPDDAWLSARRMSGANDPKVSPETVKAAADIYLDYVVPLLAQPIVEPEDDDDTKAKKAGIKAARERNKGK